MNTFLLVSGWAFWIVVAIIFLVEVALITVDNDDGVGVASFLAVCALVGAFVFTDAFKGIRFPLIAVALVAYAVLGILWSVKMWWSYLVRARDELREVYDNRVSKTSPGNETFQDYSRDRRPTAVNNKRRIVSWMMLWPLSFSWWLLTWPRRFFNWAFVRLSTLYNRISDKVFAQ